MNHTRLKFRVGFTEVILRDLEENKIIKYSQLQKSEAKVAKKAALTQKIPNKL